MINLNKGISKTGSGVTNDTKDMKKKGRVKLTNQDKEKRYIEGYLVRMQKRNESITDDYDKLKILSLENWKEKNMPSGETKNEIFVRLAKTRLAKFDRAVETLILLSDYPYTIDQGENILNKFITPAYENLKTAFIKCEKIPIEDKKYEI